MIANYPNDSIIVHKPNKTCTGCITMFQIEDWEEWSQKHVHHDFDLYHRIGGCPSVAIQGHGLLNERRNDFRELAL